MQVVDRGGVLWGCLIPEVRGLIEDGELILRFADKHREAGEISDYSFLVFPFAKAYEGFLKKLLLDLGLIDENDYYSDSIRIGRILNPHFEKEEKNVFNRLCNHAGQGSTVSHVLWEAWKKGRNRVFHFFPHNFRKLEFDEAVAIVKELVAAMEISVKECRIR